MKKSICILILLVSVFTGNTQDLNISHYPFYRDGLNPGSFMQNNDMNLFIAYNNEFSGFAQQPSTALLDLSYNINRHKIGLSIVNDVIGYDRAQDIKIRYAKQFQLNSKAFFSLGLRAGTISNRYEATKMTFEEENDPMSFMDYSYTRFDFDFGAEFQYDKLFVGLSAAHLGKQISNPDNDSPATHYYGYAQYALNPDNIIRFYPNLLVRKWKNTFWTEGGLVMFYKNLVWLGITYTQYHDFTALTGMRIKKNIMFGYAFKSNMNSNIIRPLQTNSHEIFLNFALNKNRGIIRSVRFVD